MVVGLAQQDTQASLAETTRAPIISDVSLVGFDDPGYLQRRIPDDLRVEAGKCRRCGTPNYKSLWGIFAEECVRNYLGTMVPLSPKRILTYLELRPSGFTQRYYRELDAVMTAPDGSLTVIELKCSANQSAISKGVGQLNWSAEKLAMEYGAIHRLLALLPPPWARSLDIKSIQGVVNHGQIAGAPLRLVDDINETPANNAIGVLWLDPKRLKLPPAPRENRRSKTLGLH